MTTEPKDQRVAVDTVIRQMRSAVTLSAQTGAPVADRQLISDWADELDAAQSQPPAVSDVEAAFRWGNRYASDLEEGADDEELGVEQRQVQATIAVYLRILLDRARITTTPASEREDEGYPGIAHDFTQASERLKELTEENTALRGRLARLAKHLADTTEALEDSL